MSLHLSFPVRSTSRGIVIGIALTQNQSPLDAKTLSSLPKHETFLSHVRPPEVKFYYLRVLRMSCRSLLAVTDLKTECLRPVKIVSNAMDSKTKESTM